MMRESSDVTIVGRIQSGATMAYTSKGKPLCKALVAVNQGPQRGEELIPVTGWGDAGQAIHSLSQSGGYAQVYLSGRLSGKKFQKKDGTESVFMDLVIFHVARLDEIQGDSFAAPTPAPEPRFTEEDVPF